MALDLFRSRWLVAGQGGGGWLQKGKEIIDTTHRLCQKLGVIPLFEKNGLLPAGVHWAISMDDLSARFGSNGHRQRLLRGFSRAADSLAGAGCSSLFLDGSFVSAKEYPDDYDACWETTGVDLARLDPLFLDFNNLRARQKARFFGEFFPVLARAESSSPFRTFFEFFQTDKVSGEAKGIVGIKLVAAL